MTMVTEMAVTKWINFLLDLMVVIEIHWIHCQVLANNPGVEFLGQGQRVQLHVSRTLYQWARTIDFALEY